MPGRFSNWTMEQRNEISALVASQALVQIEGDPELREIVDWMLDVCGLQPQPALYRLVFLATVIAAQADKP